MKKFSKYLATLLVAFSIISIGNIANARHIDTVLYRWDNVWQTRGYETIANYNENHKYKDITFTNGYTYTQSTKNISSLTDIILQITRTQYTRTYSTY